MQGTGEVPTTGTLTEDVGKRLLQRYGIAVPAAEVVSSSSAAAEAASRLGAPVAMKVVADGATHRNRWGGVRLNMRPDDAGECYEELVAVARRELGHDRCRILVEPMVPGQLEVIVGGLWDEAFGPVVAVGLGGVDVEVVADTRFCLAPLTRRDAMRLLADGLLAAALDAHNLGAEAREALADLILAVAGDGGLLLHEPIVELDINPVIVHERGAVAADVYVVRDGARPPAITAVPDEREQQRIHSALEPAFRPRSMAIVGASTNPAKLGYTVVKNIVDFGYAGELYAVHPTADEIYGCKAYPAVEALPEGVERAAILVKGEAVPAVLADCGRKGVKVVQVYSAGVSDRPGDTRAWDAVKDSMLTAATSFEFLRMIGPNCKGVYCPDSRLTMVAPAYCSDEPGGIAFISQSGSLSCDVIRRGRHYGLRFSLVLSCGDCTDVSLREYLAYCAADPATQVVALYVESVDDAGAFMRAAGALDKPVILLKGGRTAGGRRAASSHTGALASDWAMWAGSAWQANALLATDLEQLLDCMIAVQAIGTIDGPGLALFGPGGGAAVLAADEAEERGLRVRDLTPQTLERLTPFDGPGISIDNPVDVPVWALRDAEGPIHGRVVAALAADPGVDSVIVFIEVAAVFDSASAGEGEAELEAQLSSVLEVAPCGVPVSIVFRTGGSLFEEELSARLRERAMGSGLAVFDTLTRAIHAHSVLWGRARARGPA